MRFRPCIDLHRGSVKQIVGATLTDGAAPATNFQSDRPATAYADLYWRDGLQGGHVIMLGPGSELQAEQALARHPGFLQIGGGMTSRNAPDWVDKGASRIIATSFLFADGEFSFDKVRELRSAVGRERLVIDLSCRRVDRHYVVAADRWQTLTDQKVDRDTLQRLAEHCAEFLVHGIDVEGTCTGLEEPLVSGLAEWSPIPVTYAGGIRNLADVRRIGEISDGRLDFTVGSALDIFGGNGIRYADLVALDQRWRCVDS